MFTKEVGSVAAVRIQFDLTLPSATSKAALIGLLLAIAAPELGSENVTLTTYYPAPSGIYNQMITTGTTYLARDTGNVGVGTTAPSAKLHVVGNALVAGNVTVNGAATVNGDTTIAGNARVSGSASSKGYLYIDNTNSSCSETDVTQGAVCAGRYATFTPGIYVEGWWYQNRGGQVSTVDKNNNIGTKVQGLDGTGNLSIVNLTKDDSVAHVYCCVK